MEITDNIIEGMTNIIKRNWFARLLDMNDTSVSASSVFMFIITFIGFLLLIVPVILLMIEIIYNHTITTDLNGLAAYIASVTTLFVSAGITKAWSNWSHYKYNASHNLKGDNSSSTDEELIIEE